MLAVLGLMQPKGRRSARLPGTVCGNTVFTTGLCFVRICQVYFHAQTSIWPWKGVVASSLGRGCDCIHILLSLQTGFIVLCTSFLLWLYTSILLCYVYTYSYPSAYRRTPATPDSESLVMPRSSIQICTYLHCHYANLSLGIVDLGALCIRMLLVPGKHQ